MRKPSKTIFSFLKPALALALLCLSPALWAVPINTWIGSGFWSTSTNWSLGTVPVSGDNVVFDASSNSSCTIDTNVTVNSISIQNTYIGAINITTGQTVLTQSFSQDGGGFYEGNEIITVVGNFLVTGGTYSVGSGTLHVGGDFTHSGGTLTLGPSSTVYLDGTSAQTLSSTGSFYNLVDANTVGTVTLSGSTVVDGTLSMNSEATLDLGSSSLTLAGDVAMSGTILAGTSTVTYTSALAFTPAAVNYYNLNFSLGGGGTTLPSGANVVNDLQIVNSTVVIGGGGNQFKNVNLSAGGVLDGNGQSIYVSGDWTSAGTYAHGDWAGSSVTFNGANQNIYGSTSFGAFTKVVTSPATLAFQPGLIQTFYGLLTLKGEPGSLLSLRSGSQGSAWYMDTQSGVDLDFLDVQDSHNTPAQVTCTNSADSGGNNNWIFDPGDTPTPTPSFTPTPMTIDVPGDQPDIDAALTALNGYETGGTFNASYVILVHAGTYNGFSTNGLLASPDAAHTLAIQAAPGEHPWISGSLGVVVLARPNTLLKGFDIGLGGNTGNYGVVVSGDDVSVENNYIQGNNSAGQEGIRTDSANNFVLAGNLVRNIQVGIHVTNGSANGQLLKNTVVYADDRCLDVPDPNGVVKLTGNILYKGGADPVVLAWNRASSSVSEFNVFRYASGAAQFNDYSTSVPFGSYRTSFDTDDLTSVEGDPLFANVSGGQAVDFKIQSGSPAGNLVPAAAINPPYGGKDYFGYTISMEGPANAGFAQGMVIGGDYTATPTPSGIVYDVPNSYADVTAALSTINADEGGAPGDPFVQTRIVLVHAGSYAAFDTTGILGNPTSSHPLIIQAAPGEHPVFNTTAGTPLLITRPYTVVRGLDIAMPGANNIGLKVMGNSDIVEDNYLLGDYQTGQVGIFLDGAADALIAANLVNKANISMIIDNGSTDAQLLKNTFANFTNLGVDVPALGGLQRLVGNVFYKSGGGGIQLGWNPGGTAVSNYNVFFYTGGQATFWNHSTTVDLATYQGWFTQADAQSMEIDPQPVAWNSDLPSDLKMQEASVLGFIPVPELLPFGGNDYFGVSLAPSYADAGFAETYVAPTATPTFAGTPTPVHLTINPTPTGGEFIDMAAALNHINTLEGGATFNNNYILHVRNGAYGPFSTSILTSSPDATHKLMIQAAAAEHPSFSSATGVVVDIDKPYVSFHGCDVNLGSTASDGVKVTSDHDEVSANVIRGMGSFSQAGVTLDNASNASVVSNLILGPGKGVQAVTYGINNAIVKNTLVNCTDAGLSVTTYGVAVFFGNIIYHESPGAHHTISFVPGYFPPPSSGFNVYDVNGGSPDFFDGSTSNDMTWYLSYVDTTSTLAAPRFINALGNAPADFQLDPSSQAYHFVDVTYVNPYLGMDYFGNAPGGSLVSAGFWESPPGGGGSVTPTPPLTPTPGGGCNPVYVGEFGGLNLPHGIAVSAIDEVFVCETGSNTIGKYDSMGNSLSSWNSGNGPLDGPSGIAYNLGTLFVTDSGNARVVKFDLTGGYVGEWGIPGAPYGIAAGVSGTVYVVNQGLDRIEHYDFNGSLLNNFPSTASGPKGIAVNKVSGKIYVTDSANQVEVFNLGGTSMGSFGSGDLNNPSFLTVSEGSGSVMVADTGNNRLLEFDALGNSQNSYGAGFGSGPAQFDGIFAPVMGNSSQVMYITDLNNGRVQAIGCPSGGTPTPSYTPTATFTPTDSFTTTVTPTPSDTFTAAPTDTFTPSDTYTSSYTPTFTATASDTFTSSFTPTDTFSVTNTFTSSFTPTNTFSVTNTFTSSFTPTNTFSVTNTFTSSFTPTNTFSVTNTFTPSFTPTRTSTPSSTSTATFTPSNTFSATNTFTASSTTTPAFTSTFTSTSTNTSTSVPTSTNTFSSTPTNTPSFTNTFTSTNTVPPTSTFTASDTATNTTIPTSTNTVVGTATFTPTPSGGDGTALLAPGLLTVGRSAGIEVDLTYTAGAQSWASGGILRITIPGLWPAPQKTNATAPNYLSVAVTGGSLSSLSLSGSVVTIRLNSLTAGTGKVVVAYKKVNAPMTEGNYAFVTESDPLNDGSLKPIAQSPSIDLARPSVDCDTAAGISQGASQTGSVSGVGAINVAVAPNPAKAGQLLCVTLGTPAKWARWTIYDLSGNPVGKADFGPGAGECYSPAKLASGIYFLKIEFETVHEGVKSVTRKVAIIQ